MFDRNAWTRKVARPVGPAGASPGRCGHGWPPRCPGGVGREVGGGRALVAAARHQEPPTRRCAPPGGASVLVTRPRPHEVMARPCHLTWTGERTRRHSHDPGQAKVGAQLAKRAEIHSGNYAAGTRPSPFRCHPQWRAGSQHLVASPSGSSLWSRPVQRCNTLRAAPPHQPR